MTAGSSSDTYVYSADGDRLVRRQGGSTTVYLPGGMELTATGGTVTATRYYSFGGQVVAVRTGPGTAGVSTLVADHHGTAGLSIANTTRQVSRRYTDPYGAPRGAAPAAWAGDHGFLDKPVDDTGLVAVGARYYDPALGRFISVDPVMDLADPQQWHGYAYANNNPTTWSDPTGLYVNPWYTPGYTPVVGSGQLWQTPGYTPVVSGVARPPVQQRRPGLFSGMDPTMRRSQVAAATAGDYAALRAYKAQAEPFSLSRLGHGLLDLIGLIPAVGEGADGINAAWYAAEGDVTNAGLSAASMIPFAGWFASAFKWGRAGLDVAQTTARSTAEAGAAARAAAGGRIPTMTAAAVDPVTGRVATGFSGEALTPPAALRERLPDPSLEPWAASNCAEVAACTRLLDGVSEPGEQAAILDRVQIFTVRTRTGVPEPPCANCATWVPDQ